MLTADIVCGLSYGDEGKGKIVGALLQDENFDAVCKWNGGSNSGHTFLIKGLKVHGHLIPGGVFYGKPSIIGPGCVVNLQIFLQELTYLKDLGCDLSLVKVSPFAHIVEPHHIDEDQQKGKGIGTTGQGIGPAYRDKAARVGRQVKDAFSRDLLNQYAWDGELPAKFLCEGGQGLGLDINSENYPYVTSSVTLPYQACSLGFPPQAIRNIWGAGKAYDTRVGTDPFFDETIPFEDLETLERIQRVGGEFGVTTGRKRRCNWLNLDKLIRAIQVSGTTYVVISKCDILQLIRTYKLIYNDLLHTYVQWYEMKAVINKAIKDTCPLVQEIFFSYSPEKI